MPNRIPLDQGRLTRPSSAAGSGMKAPPKSQGSEGWLDEEEQQIFAGKHTKPDSEDPDTVNHLVWYEATEFTRPYPGETKVRPASDFKNRRAPKADLDD